MNVYASYFVIITIQNSEYKERRAIGQNCILDFPVNLNNRPTPYCQSLATIV